jgi:predicted ribosome quality control (RQC) complex YloA/Tae2 family protein
MKFVTFESVHDECTYNIRIGESAQENWELIDSSAQNDIWFHVDGISSCHIVLEIGNRKKTPHKSVVNQCASLCKDRSKAANMKSVKVIYTEIKNVKKADNPGSVYTKNTKTTKV